MHGCLLYFMAYVVSPMFVNIIYQFVFFETYNMG